MYRYYCSGFDINNAFGHGLGEMIKTELENTNSIVYIPGGPEKIEKSKNKYVPLFTEHFNSAGIKFDENILITPDMDSIEAQKLVKNADFVMLMGGDPFKQKEMCESLGLLSVLKEYDGVMLGFSAGAMLMSKYIIITPCSEEYPDFHIEEGLNLDNLSIYPHNNTSDEIYPDELVSGDEIYKKADLIEVAKKYGDFYLLQDHDNGVTDVSLIKSTNGNIEFYTENNGKIWIANNEEVKLFVPELNERIK